MKTIRFKNGGELVEIDEHNFMCYNVPSKNGTTMSTYSTKEKPEYDESQVLDEI
jgi:hypothetical protein